jgi:hypothetical protein
MLKGAQALPRQDIPTAADAEHLEICHRLLQNGMKTAFQIGRSPIRWDNDLEDWH